MSESWWLNQLILKICSSNWIVSPRIGVKIKNGSNHHLVVQDCVRKNNTTNSLTNFPKEFWNAEQRVGLVLLLESFSTPPKSIIPKMTPFFQAGDTFSKAHHFCPCLVSMSILFFCQSFSLLHRCLQIFGLHRSTLNAFLPHRMLVTDREDSRGTKREQNSPFVCP